MVFNSQNYDGYPLLMALTLLGDVGLTFSGRGRKCQLGKITIEINSNSNMTVDLGCHSPKMKIRY